MTHMHVHEYYTLVCVLLMSLKLAPVCHLRIPTTSHSITDCGIYTKSKLYVYAYVANEHLNSGDAVCLTDAESWIILIHVLDIVSTSSQYKCSKTVQPQTFRLQCM